MALPFVVFILKSEKVVLVRVDEPFTVLKLITLDPQSWIFRLPFTVKKFKDYCLLFLPFIKQ